MVFPMVFGVFFDQAISIHLHPRWNLPIRFRGCVQQMVCERIPENPQYE